MYHKEANRILSLLGLDIKTRKTLVDLQLDAQNSYLFTYNTFMKILYMFLALPCSSSGGLRRNCIQGVPGGKDLTSGECSLGQTIPSVDNYDTCASVFVVLFNGFMSLTSYFDVMYRY
jgi:hypothetical protein